MSLPKSPLQLLKSHRGPDVSLKLVKKAGRLSTLSQRIPEEPQPEMLKQPVPFYRLFRYSSAKDILYIGIAILTASVAGAAFPVCNFLVAEISSLMIEIEGSWFCNNRNNTPAFNTNVSADHAFIREFENTLNDVCMYLAASAAIQFVCAYIAIWMFNIVAENEIFKLKRHYLRALLRQDVAWHDTASDTVSLTHLTEDMGKVSDAIGTKLALFIYYAINSLLCITIAVYVGWLLTLVTLCITPVALCASAAVEVFTSHLSVKHQSQFSKCGLIIQQTVINIKTVMAFTGQNKQIQQYEAALKPANQTELKQQLFNAFGLGFSWLLKYCSYALSVWYATKLFYDDVDKICGSDPRIYDAKAVIVILFSILDFESNLSECAAFLDAFSEGSGAATAIYEVIDRMPAIDSLSKEGIKHETPLAGKIEFRDVHFTYPSRAHTKILKGFNLTVEAGTTVALVGASGCGKSTCLQLIQRFYDPDEGEILVDGIDIRKYNVRWYRSQIAVVNQEPTLFDTTIEENIRFGNPDISEADLEEAIRKAQAHRFIARLPHRLKTRVGERGAQLSGGQKQRIAICRAIIKNPSILLLDEITSALDVAAEAAVQKAIDRIKRGRTTIIVAHRIATLRNADMIGIVHDGRIVALGPPEELGKQANMFLGRLLAETVTDVDEDSLGGVTSDQSVVTVVDDSDDFTVHGYDDQASVSSEEATRELRSLMCFSTIMKLVCLSKKQWPLVILGVIMCLAHGFILPATSYIFGQVLHVFAKDDRRTAEDLVAKYAIIFLGLGGISFFTQFLSLSFFGCAGESLQSRLRKMTFAAMMRQGLPWFQRPDNNVGSICARFSRDIVSIHEATGPHLGLFLGAVWTVIALLGLSVYLDWRLALVGWAFAILIFLGAFFNGRLVETEDNEGFHEEKASTIVFQAISNIRTVCMLDLQDTFIQQVTIELNRTHKSNKRRAHVLGFVFGASQAVSNFAYACIMYYGGILVLHHQTDHGNVFTIGEGLISTSLEVGLTLAYVINYSKAKIAAARIYDIIQRTVGTEDEFHGKDITACKGDIKFEDVSFSFTPNRNFAALRNISWEIGPDQHLAICGSSGSGKSTMLEMILRFHDPTHGRICLDDVDLKDIRPESLRSQMSIVSQDAALFDSSVAENIAYGMHTKKLDMRAVIVAAKQANIHDFIKSLPSGYATKVGTLGAQLSGGQKQRVAIARALATKPKILLLDEATSALDPESEGLVEQAIENSRVGRTCISIAHKLGSIQHADRILVISSGNLVEQGTHEELMDMKGVYHHMYHLQYGHHTD